MYFSAMYRFRWYC